MAYAVIHPVIDRQKSLDQLFKRSIAFKGSLPSHQPMPTGKIRLFALLIGINRYEASSLEPRETTHGLPTLRGAVADALAFKAYLEDTLGVPSSQIIVKTDEQAKRDDIIKAFQELREDERIKRGDAMLIYYAGHGMELDSPRDWEGGGNNAKIQAIVPFDCDVIDEAGQRVMPIPDRILEILLSRLADAKGDNITTIFDCCHAASGTRGKHDSDELVRSGELPPRDYPEYLDSDILQYESRNRNFSFPTQHKHRGLGSHILLAACSSTELAIERNGHGRFSAALLKLLNEVPPDSLRYSDVLKHPLLDRIPDQNPQCEGDHLDRVLFNAKVVPSRRHSFRVSYGRQANDGHGQYIIHGGTIHNITLASEFSVYRESDIRLEREIGILQVAELQPFLLSAKIPPCAPTFDLTHPTIAIRRRFGRHQDLKIFVPSGDTFRQIYPTIASAPILKDIGEGITLVEEAHQAHVELRSSSENSVIFTTRAPNTPCGLRLVHTVDHDSLAFILARTLHFYREVNYVKNDLVLSQYIDIAFYRLHQTFTTDAQTGLQEDRFNPIGPNMYVNGVIDVVVPNEDSEDIYGLKLTNRSVSDLHINIFYFNNRDLEISTWVKPHNSVNDKTLQVPLRRLGGTLAVGYGSAGYRAFHSEIPEGLDEDFGFLKIYLSTTPVNMSYLSQPSPFATSTRAIRPYIPRPKVTWTDIVIPVIQRRRR